MFLFKRTVKKAIDKRISNIKNNSNHSICNKHTLSYLKSLKKDLGL